MKLSFPMTTRELYSSIGLSTADISKINNTAFAWAVIPFESNSEKPIAIFSHFDCALDLVKRLNAFVEGGMHLTAIPKLQHPSETDRHKRLVEIGLTPYLVQFNYNNDDFELIDNVGDDLEELSVEKLMQELNQIQTSFSSGMLRSDVRGTFWAPTGHIAKMKARIFKVVLQSLIEKATD